MKKTDQRLYMNWFSYNWISTIFTLHNGKKTNPNLLHNDKTGTNLLTVLSVLCVK